MNKQGEYHLPDWWDAELGTLQEMLHHTLAERFSPNQVALVLASASIATTGHAGQKRANGKEYSVHPYRAALSLILEFGVVDEKIVAGALLHDVWRIPQSRPARLRVCLVSLFWN